jgi:aminopeptidase N
MKRLILPIVMVFMASFSYAQWNDHGHEHHGCSHVKTQHYKGAKEVFYFQSDLLWDYDVKFYFLDIAVDATSIDISGNVSIHAEVVSDVMDTLALEFTDGMQLDSLFMNGVKLSATHIYDHIFAILPASLTQGDNFVVQVFYHGTPPTGGFFSGVTNGYSNPWGKSVTWTLSEPYAARDWFPVKQVLPDKADSCWVFLTTSDEYMAGSQGLLTSVAPMPGNMVRYEWKSKYPIAYYLISFAVADYFEYNIYAKPDALGGDSILVQNFLYDSPGILNSYQADIDQTVDFIELFSDLYLLYPFHEEKYGHCLTQLGGGMEHQTMTTIGGFGFDLVAHELGHMWFGDYVTCATWSDIWINEGFASYSEYLARQYLSGQSSASGWMSSAHNSVLSAPDGSVYVPSDELDNIWRIFNSRLSYKKGAAIVHMIRFELQDDELFFDILQEFQIRYADSTATGLDFKEVVEDLSGMDFTDFFDQWYFGEGYPTYSIVWNQVGNELNMNVTQTASYPSVTPVFKMLMEYRVATTEVDTIIRLYQDANFNQFTVTLPGQVGAIMVDPDNWVLNKTGSISVGIEETQNPLYFTLGPNPATELLTLYMANTIDEIQIGVYDLAGKTMLQTRDAGSNISLNISALPKGSYLLRLFDGEHHYSRRFVKI